MLSKRMQNASVSSSNFENADYVRLLLHTEARWHSNGNCLKRFMHLYDVRSYFLSDKPEKKIMPTVDGKTFVS